MNVHHKRKSKSKRLRFYRKVLCPWYVPLVAKGKTVKERRAAWAVRDSE